MACWEGAKDALANGENSSAPDSGCFSAAAVVWCVSTVSSSPVTAPTPVYDKWWSTEQANREVMPVGSLVGQVTVGPGPGVGYSMLLVPRLMDRYMHI